VTARPDELRGLAAAAGLAAVDVLSGRTPVPPLTAVVRLARR
jgi:hypothetical protein